MQIQTNVRQAQMDRLALHFLDLAWAPATW